MLGTARGKLHTPSRTQRPTEHRGRRNHIYELSKKCRATHTDLKMDAQGGCQRQIARKGRHPTPTPWKVGSRSQQFPQADFRLAWGAVNRYDFPRICIQLTKINISTSKNKKKFRVWHDGDTASISNSMIDICRWMGNRHVVPARPPGILGSKNKFDGEDDISTCRRAVLYMYSFISCA